MKRFVNDPNFDRAVPPVWCLKPFQHIPLVLLVALVGLGVIYRLFGPDIATVVLAVAFPLVLIGGFFVLSPNMGGWFLASNIEQVWDRANMLHGYLRDYVNLNPSLASQLHTEDEQKLERQLEDLRSYNLELEEELEAIKRECKHLKTRLAGLETPSQFEVPQQVLDKLDQLERTRLLEAVQAYRVNAWTPAVAVCGMILEGRLQRLCCENNVRQGGIGDMIQRLGEAGLLKSYYQNLAEVGEFFRHRASHPTSEEFDREKTTLMLTSLLILIRDLF